MYLLGVLGGFAMTCVMVFDHNLPGTILFGCIALVCAYGVRATAGATYIDNSTVIVDNSRHVTVNVYVAGGASSSAPLEAADAVRRAVRSVNPAAVIDVKPVELERVESARVEPARAIPAPSVPLLEGPKKRKSFMALMLTGPKN